MEKTATASTHQPSAPSGPGGDKFLRWTGGARIGVFNVTWPFAKLTATRDKIVLSVVFKRYEIGKGDILSLKRYKGIFSTGLLIELVKGDMPSPLIFWTFRFGKLQEALEKLGYRSVFDAAWPHHP